MTTTLLEIAVEQKKQGWPRSCNRQEQESAIDSSNGTCKVQRLLQETWVSRGDSSQSLGQGVADLA